MTNSEIGRTHEIDALTRILSVCKTGMQGLRELALRFSSAEWKEILFRFWLQQARCASELETKIRESGGETPTETAPAPDPLDPEEEPADPAAVDKTLLLRAINQQLHVLYAYTEVRKAALPFDLRILLQRQQLQVREILERLTAAFSIHFPRPTYSRLRSLKYHSSASA